MVTLYSFHWNPQKLEKTELSIVDVLTGPERSSVYYLKDPSQRVLLPYEIFAINFTYRDGSKPYRGMEHFGIGPSLIYIPIPEEKKLLVTPHNQDLFTAHHDKIPDKRRFVVKEGFENVIKAFQIAGYSLHSRI